MREIKFRAWAHIGKMMLYTERCSGISIFINEPTLTFPIKEPISISFGEYELMQYTGMKDCHGKEVYEGDIVVVGQDTGNEYDRYIMTFNDDSHSYLAKQPGTLGSYIGPGYWNDKLLVIGNIYENPELIGGAEE